MWVIVKPRNILSVLTRNRIWKKYLAHILCYTDCALGHTTVGGGV